MGDAWGNGMFITPNTVMYVLHQDIEYWCQCTNLSLALVSGRYYLLCNWLRRRNDGIQTVKFSRLVVTSIFFNLTFHCRNGVDLGVAFENVPCGKGIAYFPAISLSQNERVQINFGATPFRHPTANYLPIDDTPRLAVAQAEFLLSLLEQTVHWERNQHLYGSTKNTSGLKVTVLADICVLFRMPLLV